MSSENRKSGVFMLKYLHKCDNPTATDGDEALVTSKNCQSSCFELLIPFNGEYGIVRGCHADFVWDEFKVTNTSCHATKVGDTSFWAGSAFCDPLIASSTRCNMKLSSGAARPEGVEGCESEAIHTCKSCNEYDGSGSCSASTTGTCKGVYCTKNNGKISGRFYESRGCSYFNPIGSNVCSWTDQVYNISTGVDMAAAFVARKKRAVSLSFRANQCYCQGELCNSSPRLATILLSIFSVSFLVFL